MHELGITQEIVSIVCDRCGGAKIRRVVLEIGRLSAVLPDAVRFCFELCREGTSAENAVLEIVETPGVGRCRKCQAEVQMDKPIGRCECGSSDLEWLSGEQLKIKEVEVIQCAQLVDVLTEAQR